jgi:hypothetical protein
VCETLRTITALQPAALQAVAASGGSQGSEADTQQLRMQLSERDAEVQQLRQEVTALKVCNTVDATPFRGFAIRIDIREGCNGNLSHADTLVHVQLPGVLEGVTALLHYRSNFGNCNRTNMQLQVAEARLRHSAQVARQPTKTRMQLYMRQTPDLDGIKNLNPHCRRRLKLLRRLSEFSRGVQN